MRIWSSTSFIATRPRLENVSDCSASREQNLQDGRAGQVATVAEVRSSHHVLGVEHLLGKLRNADSAERVSAAAGQGSEADHEEVQTREGNHVDSQLAEIGVELTGETEGGGDTGHDSRDQVVQVTVGGGAQLEGAHANVVESLYGKGTNPLLVIRSRRLTVSSHSKAIHTSLSIQKVASECSTSWWTDRVAL